MRWIKIITINAFILLFLSEILLRLFWPNPSIEPAAGVYTHHPKVRIRLHNMDEIYGGAPDPIYFNTSRLGFIESSITRKELPPDYAIAVGGSTTECLTVQEDKRWPDLLPFPTLNFGKSHMYSYNTYFNLIHVLEKIKLRPELVFVMDGINNLSQFISGGPDPFELRPRQNKSLDNSWKGFLVNHFYTGFYFFRLYKYRNIIAAYRQEALQNRSYPLIEQVTFQRWLDENRPIVHKALKTVYTSFKEVTQRNGARLVVLTQPHSYQENYQPYRGEDLRIFPVIAKQRLTVQQSQAVMQWFNGLTEEIAHEMKVPVIDMAACFDSVDVSELLYDGWHYTEKGSLFFADCLSRELLVMKEVL